MSQSESSGKSMKSLPEIVGKNLASLRKAKGLTQLELAAEIHYSDKSISKWELGYAVPSVDILMDFASFYGVTLDYLVSEQDASQIRQAIDSKAAKETRNNKAVVLAMAPVVIFLIALAVFLSGFLFRKEPEYYWWVFVWMVPAAVFVSAVGARFLYRNRVANMVLSSVFVWTLILAFCFHFTFFVPVPQNIWFILIIGAPIQVILILSSHLHLHS